MLLCGRGRACRFHFTWPVEAVRRLDGDAPTPARPPPACPAGEAVRRLEVVHPAIELLHLPGKPAGCRIGLPGAEVASGSRGRGAVRQGGALALVKLGASLADRGRGADRGTAGRLAAAAICGLGAVRQSGRNGSGTTGRAALGAPRPTVWLSGVATACGQTPASGVHFSPTRPAEEETIEARLRLRTVRVLFFSGGHTTIEAALQWR